MIIVYDLNAKFAVELTYFIGCWKDKVDIVQDFQRRTYDVRFRDEVPVQLKYYNGTNGIDTFLQIGDRALSLGGNDYSRITTT